MQHTYIRSHLEHWSASLRMCVPINISLIYNTPILIVGRGFDYFVLYLLKKWIGYVLAVRMIKHVSYKEVGQYPSQNEKINAPHTVAN